MKQSGWCYGTLRSTGTLRYSYILIHILFSMDASSFFFISSLVRSVILSLSLSFSLFLFLGPSFLRFILLHLGLSSDRTSC